MPKKVRIQDLTCAKTVERLAQAEMHVTNDQATAIARFVRDVGGIDQDTRNGRNPLRRHSEAPSNSSGW